jgi:ATP-dependent DNA ligase
VPARRRAVVCDENGLAVFDLIRGYRHDAAAVLCSFDLLELDGKNLRRTPIEERKGTLAKLLSHPREGVSSQTSRTCRLNLVAGTAGSSKTMAAWYLS